MGVIYNLLVATLVAVFSMLAVFGVYAVSLVIVVYLTGYDTSDGCRIILDGRYIICP